MMLPGETAVAQAITSQGVWERWGCIVLNKALYGRLSANLLTPLEDINDSAVKTGAGLRQIVT